PAGDPNVGAGVRQGGGDRQAESGRAPRDQRYLPGPRQSRLRCCDGANLMIMIGLVGHPRMVAEPGWPAPETSRLRAITELPEPRLQSFHLVTERGGASGGQARGTADRYPR